MRYADIPMGLGMALTQRPGGMEMFTSLSETAQKTIIKNAENINSKEEMRQYVNRLVEKHCDTFFRQ